MTPSTPDISQSPALQTPSYWGYRLQLQNLGGGHKYSVSSTLSLKLEPTQLGPSWPAPLHLSGPSVVSVPASRLPTLVTHASTGHSKKLLQHLENARSSHPGPQWTPPPWQSLQGPGGWLHHQKWNWERLWLGAEVAMSTWGQGADLWSRGPHGEHVRRRGWLARRACGPPHCPESPWGQRAALSRSPVNPQPWGQCFLVAWMNKWIKSQFKKIPLIVVFFLSGWKEEPTMELFGWACLFQSPGPHPRTTESESLELGSRTLHVSSCSRGFFNTG